MASNFKRDIAEFQRLLARRQRAAFLDAAGVALESIKVGSLLTGAPGQPVDTGNLRNSWEKEITSASTGRIFSTAEYAEAIEEGIGPHGPMSVRSQVGGFHSAKLTVAAWDRIMSASVEKIVSKEEI